jgi:hypothetical protein
VDVVVEVVLLVVLEVEVRHGLSTPAQSVCSSKSTVAHDGLKEMKGFCCRTSEQTALVPPVRRSSICAAEAMSQTILTT